ncbi:hypothetical protein ES703_67745 [subsurface metagenome]
MTPLPEDDVVLLGAGEILKQGAEGVMIHQPEVDLKVAGDEHAGLGAALDQDLLYLRQPDKGIEDTFPVIGGAHEVDVPHCLAEAAQASRRDEIAQPGISLKLGHDLLHHGEGLADGDAPPFHAHRLNLAQDILRHLIAEAR